MRDTIREKIERHFGMTFDEVIIKRHFGKNESINKLAKEAGVSHTPFIRLAKLTGIRLRTHSEASSISMSNVNNNDPNFRAKRAKTLSKTYANKLHPQEIMFKRFLDKSNIKYIMQEPIGPYNMDFFLPDKKLCIEIDSSYKWGNERKKNALVRDKYIKSKGLKVLRLNKVFLPEILKIIELIIS